MPPEADRGRRRWRLVRAGTDAVPASVRRLMSRARPEQVGKVPWKLVALTVTVVLLAGWLVFFSPALAVRQVQVAGVIILTEDEVLQAAGVPLGQPLARVDIDGVRGRVARLAVADSVSVTRRWPATLLIEVIERIPVAAVKRDDMFHIFDGKGVAFMSRSSVPADVIEVQLGATMPADKAMKSGLRVISALTPLLRSNLVRLVVNSPAGIQLQLTKDRIVVWGDAENSDLKAKVATALLTQKGKRFDVSVPEIVTIQ